MRRVKKTRESFDYQWAHLKESPWLLSNPKFREECDKILLDELGLSHKDIFGKLVLDAGCGNGRWSYAFRKLGAEVVAYDYSSSACKETKKNGTSVVMGDALNPPFRRRSFDLVFSFGVLHHTGNVTESFRKNAELVKSGGIMHVYLYGVKRMRLKLWRFLIHCIPLFKLREAAISVFIKIREKLHLSAAIPFSNLHGGFDALSPEINVESDEKFVGWLYRVNGFHTITRVKTSWCDWKVDIHMRGVKR